MDGEPPGCYVHPSLYGTEAYDPQSAYQNTELFGPNALVQEIDDLDTPLSISRETGYGLSMAIFCEERKYYEYCLERSSVGLLNWNRTTNGASSRLPFGGLGRSGNDRPSAHFAVYYCTVPVSSLEDYNNFDSDQALPGMNWKQTD